MRASGTSPVGATTPSVRRSRPRAPSRLWTAATPQLRREGEWRPRLLGEQHFGQATPPLGTFTAVSAGLPPHLRRKDERHPRLLGDGSYGQADAAPGHLHRGGRRHSTILAAYGRTAPSHAGATISPARPTARRAPSPAPRWRGRRCTSPAASSALAPSPAGARTLSARRPRPRAPLPGRAPAAITPVYVPCARLVRIAH